MPDAVGVLPSGGAAETVQTNPFRAPSGGTNPFRAPGKRRLVKLVKLVKLVRDPPLAAMPTSTCIQRYRRLHHEVRGSVQQYCAMNIYNRLKPLMNIYKDLPETAGGWMVQHGEIQNNL